MADTHVGAASPGLPPEPPIDPGAGDTPSPWPPDPDRTPGSPAPGTTPPDPGALDDAGADAAGPGEPHPYDDDFFSAIDPQSYASARVVVARVLGLTGARSVVDVGCGSGAWIRACRDLGVPEVVGVDGAYVPAGNRRQATEFIERDLEQSLDIDRRFSLALCLEVAEHLPLERAPAFVADLTSLAPVVLFSAAVPGQGGTNHVNEQWSEYWVALFEAEGWVCRDAVRPWVRSNEDVAWWYRQNLFLAISPTADAAYSSLPRLAAVRIPNPVDYVRRPRGDVMEPPLGPAPEPPVEDAAVEDLSDTLPPPADPPTTTTPPPPVDEPPRGPAGDAPPDDEDTPELIEHPRPPGWDAMRRVAGRLRRRD